MKQVAVVLAPGFEEVEAVAIIDVLRRAGCDATLIAMSDEVLVRGAHDIQVCAELPLSELTDADEFDAIVLPGGIPGATNLAADPAVLALCRSVYEDGAIVAAICAAPLALHAVGLLQGHRVTAYPGVEAKLPGCQYTGANVEVDRRVITGKAAGTALEFSLELVRQLGLPEQAEKLRHAMFVG